MVKPSPPSLKRLWLQLAAGVMYLAFVSGFLSAVTDNPFWAVFVGVVTAAVFYVGLALCWVTLWARREDSKVGQYTIGSFFFLTVFLAGFLSLTRWVATAFAREDLGSTTPTVGQFLAVALVCSVFLTASIPFMLRAAESVIWLSVRFLRRKRKDDS